jgi:hypothetical protein
LATGLPKKDAEGMKDKPEISERFKGIANDILGFSSDEFLQ